MVMARSLATSVSASKFAPPRLNIIKLTKICASPRKWRFFINIFGEF